MKKLTYFILLITTTLFSCKNENTEKPQYRLWYTQSATRFEEALPLGNGRLGAMPDGNINEEKIILNEITLWSGCEHDFDNPDAAQYLPEIRELLKAGKNAEAQELVYKTFVCRDRGSASPMYGSYQLVGNLNLSYKHDAGEIKNYTRELILDNAISRTSYSINDIDYTREYLASFSDDVIVIHLKSNRKKKLNFSATMDRPERFTTSADKSSNTLWMKGELDSGKENIQGMKYSAGLKIITDGTQETDDKEIKIKDASVATIYLSIATSFNNTDEDASAKDLLNKAIDGNYDVQRNKHIQNYRSLFDRADISFGNNDADTLTTIQRLNAFYKDNKADTYFASLFFQYGRYLLISSTRPGLLPPNLQGLWANTIRTPWNGDYHMNINVQMNHWPCEITNLPELHTPFIEQTKSLSTPGAKTAKVFYNAEGWVAHMMTNIWGFTAPGEHPSWGATNTGGAWNCSHLWEHYEYNKDIEFLKSIYPVLKGASKFFLDMLMPEPEHGWLVTAPSTSPENAYWMNGKALSVCMGPTMDNQIIRELLTNTITAANTLGVDKDFVNIMKETKEKLPPHQIGKHGQLMEWLEDYEEVEPTHRHVSHLYGLHPSNQITPWGTPELAGAARKTLERRGDGGTGWSRAWKVNFWARLGDGNHSYKVLTELLRPVANSDFNYTNGGGTYPNLFDAHPPFQIDGNFGGCSGIAEMVLQSHGGFVEYLPALPDALKDGSFHGLRVRGGGETDATWQEGKLQKFELRANSDHTFKIKIPEGNIEFFKNGKKETVSPENGFIVITLAKGDKINATIN